VTATFRPTRPLPPQPPQLPGDPALRRCLTCGAVCSRLECRDCERVSARRALGTVGWGEVAVAFAAGAALALALAWLGGAR